MDHYDSIVVGAGHNGLVCAAYLARGGQKVLVLEAADTAGGLIAEREFHPGYRVSVAQTVSHFPRQIANDLDLSAHGYRDPDLSMPTVALGSDGEHVVIREDSVSGVSEDDADSFRSYQAQMSRFADALAPSWRKTMPRIGANGISELITFVQLGLKLRLLGKRDMREFMRVASLPARDLMDENFDSPLLKAALSWDGLVGARMAPRSPNSAVLAMLYRLAGNPGGMHRIPRGGVNCLAAALSSSAEAAGAEIRCASPVDRILIDGSADGLVATGVQMGDGEKVTADRIISAADPKRTFFDLVGVEYLDIGFTNRVRRLRSNGYVAKLHLALDGVPEFDGFDDAGGRMIIAPAMDAIEFAYDDAKYGDCSANPVMEIVVPSVHDASLAPAGKHVLSANVMYVPYTLKGGWTESARNSILNCTIDTIARYAPGIRDQVVHGELLTPADLETRYRVTGGHWHHIEFAMDQMLMMRPTYEAAQYRTPIPGLFLCGAGCHPGGDITGYAGHNAAREILR